MNKPQTGIRFRSEMLGCSHIQRLAEYVAAEYGLPRVDRALVCRMYAQAMPIPISLENEKGQLWVDKYYLAYRLLDGTEFIGRGIAPDAECEISADDLRAGTDSVLREALRRLREA